MPDEATVRRAVECAVRAPSIYNCQPWRWRASTSDGVDLFADPDRHLITTDPQGRDLLLSCGAALHHLTVAFADLGWSVQITRFPDPENVHHLAHVQPRPVAPPAGMARLARAIPRRHTDRRRFSADPVAVELLDTLVEQAASCGAELYVVTDTTTRRHLIETITASASLQRQQLGYAAEIARWAGRYAGSDDGIPPGTVPSGLSRPGDVPMRSFRQGTLAQPPHSFEHEDASVLMVLGTDRDDRLAALRAGEATSAVLLAATDLGLATTPIGQPLEVPQTRASISTHIGPQMVAQLVLRVGWADRGAPELPPTPRRRLDRVLLPSR